MDYSGPDGPRRTLATNFEPAEARKLLPCWDEPARKATFTVSVDAPKDRMAVSNMPVAEVTLALSDDAAGALRNQPEDVDLSAVPRASAISSGFIRPVDGVDVGVVVKRGDTAKAAYALEQAGKLLHYYNDYFGVAFPLPKLDLIAAPGPDLRRLDGELGRDLLFAEPSAVRSRRLPPKTIASWCSWW